MAALLPPSYGQEAGELPVLVVQGNRFFAAGGDARFQPVVVCCNGYPENGWPFISEEQLRLIQDAGINATHIRTGPFTRHGEPGEPETPPFDTYVRAADGRYDLARFNDEFWARADGVVRQAAGYGIYVEVDLVDHWVRHHGCPLGGPCDLALIDPWNARNNIQNEEHGGLTIFSRPPDAVHEAFVRKAVAMLGRHPNVIFSAGNEAFKFAQASGRSALPLLRPPRPYSILRVWEEAVVAIVRDELDRRAYGRRLIGSSSHDPEIEQAPWLDYIIRHKRRAQGPESKPVVVNEHPDLPAAEVLAEVIRARSVGTYFGYFRGSHDDVTWEDTLRQIGALRRPRPALLEIPAHVQDEVRRRP